MSSVAVDNSTARLLRLWQQGDESAKDTLFDSLYHELKALSRAYISREGKLSLASGDLVHEACIRLMQLEQLDWQSRSHFLAIAATTMRRVLIDHARKKSAQKRDVPLVTLVTEFHANQTTEISLVEINAALEALEAIDPERAKVVEMRFFGGLSLDEIATALNVSKSTIKRQWRSSRAWLLTRLSTH